MSQPGHIPELLAPAGDWECARAAVENGADAIYFGLDRFNARMRAKNFTLADLPELMEFLHRRGVRGYVTFNTLVFSDEMADAEEYLRGIIGGGADAAIVQDVGICRMIRALSPDFPIHCSTQMTITSAAGVAFAQSLGAQLVVLARENSLEDIAKIQAAQTGPSALPLEVFVHGALCVAFSGQCLTSEALGGRSANRGECAQACRLPYELVSDGATVPLGDRRYLLSPQDLAGLEVLPELIRTGVASLKIEGRLKSAEYVASITRVYRQALDGAASARARYELEMTFSRGLSPGWFKGIDNRSLVHARFGTKRGVFLGTVERVDDEAVTLRLESQLKPGDGVVFDAGRPDAPEEGGRVYQVEAIGRGQSVLRFGSGDIAWGRVRSGQKLWKTDDPALGKELRATFAGDAIRFRRPVHLEAFGSEGEPLSVVLRDENGREARAQSALPLTQARTQPLDSERLRAQFERLGGTPFRLGTLRSAVSDGLMLPMSELNRLRREVVDGLSGARANGPRWTLNGPLSAPVFAPHPDPSAPELIALIRLPTQLRAAWTAGVRTIYCEFENPKAYREAVAEFRGLQTQGEPGSSIWVAPPRIFLPGEEWILEQVRSSGPDGFLARNHDHLGFYAGERLRGDFSLNVANPWTAEFFCQRYGLERLTASYDLNIGQLEALLRTAPPARFDLTLHQHMPMFHMNHCVFCAFLSTGKDYRDCGRPCEKHRVGLRDRVGAELPLKADAGCRNTVYNNRAQSGAEYASRLIGLGARNFRIEFVNEEPGEVAQTLDRYRRLLSGEISGADLWRELKLIHQLGVTRGQMSGS
jgi:putative protease